MTKSALVLVANGSEEIETITVVDVLRRAGISVTLASVTDSTEVECSRKVKVVADAILSTLPIGDFDVLALPGGLAGAREFSTQPAVQDLIKRFWEGHKVVAAMCASTTALKAARIGHGMKATSYPSFKDELGDYYDYQESDVVVDGRLITSRGPGTAMAWSLAIVSRLLGDETAHKIASQMLFKF